MKERPILFSAPMVRAILAGTKTQTRRVVKGLALDWLHQGFTPEYVSLSENYMCRHGLPGDRLWVREAFGEHCSNDLIVYRADFVAGEFEPVNRWRPSIHMPRSMSRILLEITAVRVERLNEISEADAKAEGVTLPTRTCTMYDGIWRDEYRVLWESINGAGSWDANPFVWVIEFRRIDAR